MPLPKFDPLLQFRAPYNYELAGKHYQFVMDDGNEYYTKQLYIDDSGNLVLNGTLSVFTSSGETTNLEDISNSITMEEVSTKV